jgi:hypothetical protein
MTIKEAIYQYFTQFLSKEKVYAKTGVVSNVNETTRLCDVTPNDGSPIVYNVRLQALKDSTTGFVQIPKAGTECVITFINRSTAVLISCKEITKLIVDADTIIQFNGGALGGMVKVASLVSAYNSVVTDLNTIRAALNGLGVPIVITATTKTNSDFENVKVKQ